MVHLEESVNCQLVLTPCTMQLVNPLNNDSSFFFLPYLNKITQTHLRVKLTFKVIKMDKQLRRN